MKDSVVRGDRRRPRSGRWWRPARAWKCEAWASLLAHISAPGQAVMRGYAAPAGRAARIESGGTPPTSGPGYGASSLAATCKNASICVLC